MGFQEKYGILKTLIFFANLPIMNCKPILRSPIIYTEIVMILMPGHGVSPFEQVAWWLENFNDNAP